MVRVITTFVAILALRAALDFTYVNYVAKFSVYSFGVGLCPVSGIDTFRLLESYVVALALGFCLVSSLYSRWRPSGVALALYFVVVLLPLSSLYGLTDAPAPFFYAAMGSFAVLIAITGLLPKVKILRPSRGLAFWGLVVVLGISAYVYGWLLLSGGLERLSFDLPSVYKVRAGYTQSRGPFMGYFVPWQGNVINTLVLCYALNRRKRCLLWFSIVAQLFLFGMTGHRSHLLAPALVIGIYFVWGARNPLFYVFSGALSLVLASYAFFLLTGKHLMPSLFIRRLFFVPAANHLIYYDFFSQSEHPFVMLSNSVLKPFLRYPYDMSITRVISWAYWERDFSPNVGYLGDAFAQFGFAGMFLFSVILGGFLQIVDSIGARLPASLVAAVIATPAMALTNSALFTSLLTHGWIPAVILLWLLKVTEGRRSSADVARHVVLSVTADGHT